MWTTIRPLKRARCSWRLIQKIIKWQWIGRVPNTIPRSPAPMPRRTMCPLLPPIPPPPPTPPPPPPHPPPPHPPPPPPPPPRQHNKNRPPHPNTTPTTAQGRKNR